MNINDELNPDYKPAYLNTNEDLRWITSVTPKPSRVLTVAASGDQALFYRLGGAKTIDTFDITKMAGLIQEIKTTAIQHLTHEQYMEMMQGLRAALVLPKHMDKILPLLSQHNQNLWNRFGPYSRLLNGNYCEYANPTRPEFNKLKSMVSGPFNFIHSPLDTLHTKITGQYDIINISNIFDLIHTDQQQQQIILNLLPHLTVGGHFLYISGFGDKNFNIRHLAHPSGAEIKHTKTLSKPCEPWDIISLQRTR